MWRKKPVIALIIFLLMSPGLASATNTVLSSLFDGTEQLIDPLPGTCGGSEALSYQAVSEVRVSVSGNYVVSDVFNFNGVDVSALVYRGSFDPNSPTTNVLTPDGIDIKGEVELTAGTAYVLVVQNWCSNREGAWSVSFSGPGEVTSGVNVTLPEPFEGGFSSSDPQTNSRCGDSQYQQIGPIRVGETGTYYYSDVSIHYAVDMCLQIYSQPFDAANPDANRLGVEMDDFGSVELEVGKDYYFVVQPWDDANTGEFFFVFAPPAPFRINKALAGSWYDPPTSGQGFFIDVFDNSNLLFLAWFTFDLQRPDDGIESGIGEPGHRWMTALGPFVGNTATIPIYWASGMVFDSVNPPVSQAEDGSMTVTFESCTKGMIDYDLGTANVSGQVPIQPIALDFLALCQSLTEGPGKPGEL